jgi:hypothetical protein
LLATLLLLSLLAALVSLQQIDPGATQATSSPEERREAFRWFGTLGFPDVKDCPLVRVATGRWHRYGDDPPENTFVEGFLLAEHGDTFSVFTLALDTLTLQKTPDDTAAHERVGYEVLNLAEEAAASLRALREAARGKELDRIMGRFGERLRQRTEVFVLAWACWRHGLDDLAGELYEQAAHMPDYHPRPDQPKRTFPQVVAADLAHAHMWRAVLDFGEPEVSRPQLLEKFRHLVRHYPESEHIGSARETVALLEQMVQEDEEHGRRRHGGKPFVQLNKQEQIAELIFLLRDQNGQQWSQPGSCDIFLTRDGSEDTPAHQLVRMGYDAVPQLIAVLEDRRFSRSVGFHRDFYFSHFVLRVGDCAEQIISRIAGRSFYQPKSTYAAMLKDGEAAGVKAEVLAWYAELQHKGEKQLLIEATAKGDRNSPGQAERLLAKYPEAAFPALVAGTRSAEDDWTRAALVGLAGKLPGDGPLSLLLAEAKDGPSVACRLAAARCLHERGRPEGVAAMIAEWNRERPASQEEPLESVAGFLAGCNRREAIAALAKDLRKRPVDLRLAVVSAFGESHFLGVVAAAGGAALRPGENRASRISEPVREAIEELLIAALDDREERAGMSGTWNGKSFSDPRVCDLAGHVLHQFLPDRYSFDLSAPLEQRDRNLVELKNVWRRAHGQPPLPLPARPVIPTVADERLLPLVEKFLHGPADEQAKAEQQIHQLGLGALPGVVRRLEKTGKGELARPALEALSRRLACLVVAVVIADDSLPPGPTLAGQLEAMKGKPFDPRVFIRTISTLMGTLPRSVHGLRFSTHRPGDGGMTIRVDLLDEARAARLARSATVSPGLAAPKDKPYSWNFSEQVTVGRKSLRGLFGGTAGDWIKGEHPDLEEALTRACAAPPTEPIEIRIQLLAEWLK